VDLIPTLKTKNNRICVVTDDGRVGLLAIEDAERLQVHTCQSLSLSLSLSLSFSLSLILSLSLPFSLYASLYIRLAMLGMY
jgi:hypothetical protein